MANYQFLIQYDGTRYAGWQSQPGVDNTIQGKIEDVLARMEPEQPYPIHLASAGRTDAGVHALAQSASIHLETKKSPEEIREYCNRYLPEDIGILTVRPVPERFHARLRASGKTYVYRIATDPAMHVFERKFLTPLAETAQRVEGNWYRGMYPDCNPEELKRRLSDGPDLEEMRKAAGILCGKHDFASFCSKRMKKSSVRTIEKIEIEELPGELRLSFTGDGFLYNMVRILTGTLMETAFHARTAESVQELVEHPDRNRSGFTAPARGLQLKEVFYDPKELEFN